MTTTKTIRGYCAQCASYCPTIAHVREGLFVKVEPDREHPNANRLCPKGIAGPELVYSGERLQHPMKRTRPKEDPDPGWERISWDEALDTIARRLLEIREEYGPESVAIGRGSTSGSPFGDLNPWIYRLAHAFGTPNTIATTHICQWHRDRCSEYTFGKSGTRWGQGVPDFERSGCILIWGKNLHTTDLSRLRDAKAGLKRGARLIVIDPRRTRAAAMADCWLRIRPGADGALALSMIHVMIEEALYDRGFLLQWTTAPFLIREDTGTFLRGDELAGVDEPGEYLFLDSGSGECAPYSRGVDIQAEPELEGSINVKLRSGATALCRTAFSRLRERAARYCPGETEEVTWVPEKQVRKAVRMFTREKPASLYTWNGIEQGHCASQTNRAICILYAMTGEFDVAGGNVIPPSLPINQVAGNDLLDRGADSRRLGSAERPLGPSRGGRVTQAYPFYRAVLTGRPYPVRALLGFGGNLVSSNPGSATARDALLKLDFYAQTELFMTPSTLLADIVLPASSYWESWHVRTDFLCPKTRGHVQYRPAVIPPLHESWPDLKIISHLARRLGLAEFFWNGDIEAGFDHMLKPLNLKVSDLKARPGGITLDLPLQHRKYGGEGQGAGFRGFKTPSGRIELYQQAFMEHGHDPLPAWGPPPFFRKGDSWSSAEYPLVLTTGKLLHFCHSQHRSIPSLRKAVPHPYLEIHPETASSLGIQKGEWVLLETPYGAITLRSKLVDTLDARVVCTQHGWWQECRGLGLPGHDPYSTCGANVNLILSTDLIDPISGCVHMRGYPCRVRKK